MRQTPSKVQVMGLLAIAITMFAIAAVTPRLAVIPIAIAVAALVLLASLLSEAGRLAKDLRPFQNRPIEIRVWGKPLPVGGDGTCEITSVRVLGAGLHLFVLCGDGVRRHLKIAQPRHAEIGEQTVEIREAAYVQWVRQRLPRVPEAAAVTLSVRTNEESPR